MQFMRIFFPFSFRDKKKINYLADIIKASTWSAIGRETKNKQKEKLLWFISLPVINKPKNKPLVSFILGVS